MHMCNATCTDNGKRQRDSVTYLACSKRTYLPSTNALFCDNGLARVIPPLLIHGHGHKHITHLS